MTRDLALEALYGAARELTGDLLPRVKALIRQPEAAPDRSQTGPRGKAAEAPAPWNDAAAGLYFDIHATARRHESALTARLWHRTLVRPLADVHTVTTINRLPVLLDHAAAAGLTDDDTGPVAADLHRWPVRCRALLDEARPGEERPRTVPGDPRCPHCSTVLMLGAGWRALEANATAYCPVCTDENGRRLEWPVTERIGRLQRDELVALSVAARRYGLKPSRVWQWKHRGKIHPHGVDESGRALYRVADLNRLADVADLADGRLPG